MKMVCCKCGKTLWSPSLKEALDVGWFWIRIEYPPSVGYWVAEFCPDHADPETVACAIAGTIQSDLETTRPGGDE